MGRGYHIYVISTITNSQSTCMFKLLADKTYYFCFLLW